MADHLTPMPGEQACTGQVGGHVPLDAAGEASLDRFGGRVPSSSGFIVVATAAPSGYPCIGSTNREYAPDGSIRRTHTHLLAISIGFFLHREGKLVSILALRTPEGAAHEQLTGFELLTSAEAEALIAAWRSVFLPTVPLGPGRPQWSGSLFTSAADCLGTLRDAMRALLATATSPTQDAVLGWLADHRDPAFRTADVRRIPEWCDRAGTSWKTFRHKTITEYDAGFAHGQEPDATGP